MITIWVKRGIVDLVRFVWKQTQIRGILLRSAGVVWYTKISKEEKENKRFVRMLI